MSLLLVTCMYFVPSLLRFLVLSLRPWSGLYDLTYLSTFAGIHIYTAMILIWLMLKVPYIIILLYVQREKVYEYLMS
jgi:hypothetical protein